MAEDLQALMERIQKDAVEKAELAAADIISKAKGLPKTKPKQNSKTPIRKHKHLQNAANALWNSPLAICSSRWARTSKR